MRRSIRFSPWPILFTLMAIAMAVGVFAVTQRVQHREAQVAEMNRQLLTEQQAMRVLDAEWAYLTRPQRLEELVTMKEATTDVMPPAPTPITTVVEETPAKIEAVAAIEPAAAEAVVVDDVAPAVKPVTLQEDASVKEVTPPEQEPVKKAAVRKAEVKKPDVKKVAAKAAPAPKIKTAAKAKAAPVDDVWRITPKVRTQQTQQQVVSYKPRVGVARPIVE